MLTEDSGIQTVVAALARKINAHIIWIQLISPLLIPVRAPDTEILHYSPDLSAPQRWRLRKQIQLFDFIYSLWCTRGAPVWVSLLVVILRKRPVERIDSSSFSLFFFLLFCGKRQVAEVSLSVPVDWVSDNNFDTLVGFCVSVLAFYETKFCSQPFQTSLIWEMRSSQSNKSR